MFFTDHVCDSVARWGELKRWERREIGRELRRMGLSYSEISRLVPVTKGTLSGWCRDLELGAEARARLAGLRRPREIDAQLGQRRREQNRTRVQRLRREATQEAAGWTSDPLWVAGVVAYWGEGTKAGHAVAFSNSDPHLARLFMTWSRRYLHLTDDRYRVQLHLHSGQDVDACMTHWGSVLSVPRASFTRPFIKSEGTGHRKKVIYMGTALVRVTRSGDLLHKVLGWIDALREGPTGWVHSGSGAASSTG
ncbi:MAG TPA: hypothetical protein VM840_10570 [Actinomycetota bacterium]|nr:hypothetical protein [Actinomycetota bacterium]